MVDYPFLCVARVWGGGLLFFVRKLFTTRSVESGMLPNQPESNRLPPECSNSVPTGENAKKVAPEAGAHARATEYFHLLAKWDGEALQKQASPDPSLN